MRKQMRELVDWLNHCSDEYYNNNNSLISDFEFDRLIDQLSEMERSEKFVYDDSPTKNVGFEVRKVLPKVEFYTPMLSLDKTKSEQDVVKFANEYDVVAMPKIDGLSCRLTYENGVLVLANTRGNGIVGEDITHNARVVRNIPRRISHKEKLVVDGEIICKKNDFEAYKLLHPEVKNQRNFASGSIRLLDSEECSKRNLSFIAWDVIEGFDDDNISDRLVRLYKYRFEIAVPLSFQIKNVRSMHVDTMNTFIKNESAENGIYIDGVVYKINSRKIGDSKGRTEKFFNNAIAFKFYDKSYTTKLVYIDWNVSRNGTLTPVAVFESVNIDNTDVSRATLHNINYIEDLKLSIGDTITVVKSQQIIPRVQSNLSAESKQDYNVKDVIPKYCPMCGRMTSISISGSGAKTLLCTNIDCNGVLLEKLNHFVSKDAMNIVGFSRETLRKFVELGTIHDLRDIYSLKDRKSSIICLNGFTKNSVDKLIESIEKSRETTLERFIYALGIPLVGKTASKKIADIFNGDYYSFKEYMDSVNSFANIYDLGSKVSISLIDNYKHNKGEINGLAQYLFFKKSKKSKINNKLNSKTFVITGSVQTYKNRNELKSVIESYGGKVTSNVSKTTDYLINNDADSNSSKNNKAKSLGIKIISETDFREMIGG